MLFSSENTVLIYGIHTIFNSRKLRIDALQRKTNLLFIVRTQEYHSDPDLSREHICAIRRHCALRSAQSGRNNVVTVPFFPFYAKRSARAPCTARFPRLERSNETVGTPPVIDKEEEDETRWTSISAIFSFGCPCADQPSKVTSNNMNSPRQFDTKVFLQRVREFSFLCNKELPNYENAMAKDNRWTLIVAEFGPLCKRDAIDFTARALPAI